MAKRKRHESPKIYGSFLEDFCRILDGLEKYGRNVTRDQIRQRVGVSQGAISNYMNGKMPESPIMIRLEKAKDDYGVELREFVSRQKMADAKRPKDATKVTCYMHCDSAQTQLYLIVAALLVPTQLT